MEEPKDVPIKPAARMPIRPDHLKDPWDRCQGRGGLSMGGPAVDLTDPRLILSIDLLGGNRGNS